MTAPPAEEMEQYFRAFAAGAGWKIRVFLDLNNQTISDAAGCRRLVRGASA